MTVEERMDFAARCKRDMNCCQAVVKAFADTVDVPEADLVRLAAGFGAGMGTMEGTCGALVGAIAIASLQAGGGEAMKRTRQIVPRFRDLCGGTICRDLKGLDTGKPRCRCEDCVRNAVRAAAEAGA